MSHLLKVNFKKFILNIVCWLFLNIGTLFIVIMLTLLFFKLTGISAPIHEKSFNLFEDIDFAFNVGFYSLIPVNLLYLFFKMKNWIKT